MFVSNIQINRNSKYMLTEAFVFALLLADKIVFVSFQTLVQKLFTSIRIGVEVVSHQIFIPFANSLSQFARVSWIVDQFIENSTQKFCLNSNRINIEFRNFDWIHVFFSSFFKWWKWTAESKLEMKIKRWISHPDHRKIYDTVNSTPSNTENSSLWFLDEYFLSICVSLQKRRSLPSSPVIHERHGLFESHLLCFCKLKKNFDCWLTWAWTAHGGHSTGTNMTVRRAWRSIWKLSREYWGTIISM